MKHFFSTLFVVFFATSLMAQSGLTCEDPIPVNSDYVGRVDGPCTLWYTAGSYDLPLKVHFIPDADNSTWGPEVTVDFTCTPGVYDDPKLDSLLTMVADFDVSFPVEFLCNLVTSNGKNEWDLSINENYRETLAEYGITYNLQAFVKVVFEEAGVVSLRPDSAFQACMENTPKINLGDTIEILPNDSNSACIFSYTEWQEDSIRFVWVGDEPARVHLATVDCEFVPVENNGFIWNRIDLVDGTPYKLYSEQMKSDIKKNKAGGLYYGKIISPVAGKFVVEKIPMNAAQGGAILLEYGKKVQIDTDALYCFPRTWNSTQFVSPTDFILTMCASPLYDFALDSEDCYIYTFSKEEEGRVLNLSSVEMSALTGVAKDDYIYVRFACNASISITPEMWAPSECANQSTLIRPNEAFFVFERSSNTIFRLRYVDWVGYDMTIEWDGSVKLPTYIADACSYTLSSSNSHVLQYAEIKSGGTFDISAATIETWASRVDADGYLYVRFNPTKLGVAVFMSSKPEDVDPEIPDPVYTTESATICFGETYPWNGKEYNATGKYTYTTIAANGADSIVTLDLTVYPQTEATTENVEVAYGETYTWNGITYAESGEYTITLQDENGCDYQATLILTVLPEEKPVSPCVAASTLLEPVAELTLNLGNAFDIYRIDYEAWLASGVNLVWTGKGALHTFVAKDCEFAVAIYHKDVVNYTEVPAEGNVVLSKAILAPLAQYVDADGYLYVRFLTELEGQLTTALAE